MIAKTLFITNIAAKLRAEKQIVTFEELAAQLSESGFRDHNGNPFTSSKEAAELVKAVRDRLQLQGLTTESEHVEQAFM